jgi:hypothetical protein
MSEPYDISSDSELLERVRSVTDYADTADELAQHDLVGLRKTAKMEMALKTDLEDPDWYGDSGLALALLGVTCIYAKCHVENYSVQSWSVDGGAVDITARDSNGNSIQFSRYESMIETGLSSADNVSSTYESPTNINSAAYIG